MWDGEFRKKNYKTKTQTLFWDVHGSEFSFCCQALLENQSMTKGQSGLDSV